MSSSSGPPGIGLLLEPQIYEGLGRADARYGSDLRVDHFEEMLVVARGELDEEVVRAGADDDVVDLGVRAQLGGELAHIAVDLDPDHGLTVEADPEWIGHRDDLHHPGVEEALDPLPYRRLRQADRL